MLRGKASSERERRGRLATKNVFRIDQSKSMFDQEVPGHNRWHPEISSAVRVRPGQDFRMGCRREWTDGQVKNTHDANAIRDMALSFNHVLSDPVAVEGVEPGTSCGEPPPRPDISCSSG